MLVLKLGHQNFEYILKLHNLYVVPRKVVTIAENNNVLMSIKTTNESLTVKLV